MKFSIRDAEPKDGDDIGEILSAFIDETPWMPRIHSREGDRKFGASLIQKTEVKIADSNGIVGFLACHEGLIDALYIRSDHQGLGIGSALIENIQSKGEQLALWTFQVNEGARRFYARHGFKEVKMTDGQGNDEKLPDVYLTWDPAAS